MPLVKRDQSNKFIESYEINSFRVDLDNKIVNVQMSKYILSSSGIPTASDFSYQIADKTENKTEPEVVQQTVPKRDSSGAIIHDENGNPVTETIEVTVEKIVPVEIKAFSEIISTLTSGKPLYEEIKKALYESFIKYELKDGTGFVIE
jgi:hypothetical protein